MSLTATSPETIEGAPGAPSPALMDDLTPLDADEARALTDCIRTQLDAVWGLITVAYNRRADLALGYPSWDAYCTAEFGSSRLGLPREERDEVITSMRAAGMSQRAIASATGLSQSTVERSTDPNGSVNDRVVGLDGKSRPATRKRTRKVPTSVPSTSSPPPRTARRLDGKSPSGRAAELRATPKGDYGRLLRLSVEMSKLSAVVQAYHPEYYAPDEVSPADPVYGIVCTFHDDLADLSRWIDEALVATQTWLGDVDVRRKIAKLRDPTGRTPEEVKAARRVADRLQRKLGAQLPKGSRV